MPSPYEGIPPSSENGSHQVAELLFQQNFLRPVYRRRPMLTDPSDHPETQYEVIRKKGISRRTFLRYCALTAAALGLGPLGQMEIARAMETSPYLPVIWINGLSCSCCTESFIRTAHPLASDIVLTMIALEYQDTIMAAAGSQAEADFEEAIQRHRGNYILAVEGNAPLGEDGMYCIDGGRPFLDKLKKGAEGAKAIVAWGNCASWGCVQAAHPNPTTATPVLDLIHDRPVIRIPGCPPIPEVMSSLVAYIITYNRLPSLDSQNRPLVFYGKRVHDQCVRRAHFDAGQFVESWDDEAARLGYCLYKMGCKGPTTFNACPTTRWNDGVSYPIQSGHGCLGCASQRFWDHGSFYDRITNIPHLGTHTTAETVGAAMIGGIGAGVLTHGLISAGVHLSRHPRPGTPPEASAPSTSAVSSEPKQEAPASANPSAANKRDDA